MTTPQNATESLQLRLAAQHDHVKYDEEFEMHVCASVTACDADEANRSEDNTESTVRKSIDIVVVLDRSGSMSGDKLSMCKATCEFIVQEMQAGDRLSIVTFDDDVLLDLGMIAMTTSGKAAATQAIKNICTGGCTNLSGGLFQGLTTLKESLPSSKAETKAVLLLTDGHANRGVSDPEQLLSLTKQSIASLGPDGENTRIFCFGYGSNHQSDLLRSIAEAANGSYYFVEHNDQVAEAFGDCLGGLMSVAAQQVVLNIETVGGTSFIGDPLVKFPCSKPAANVFQVRIPDVFLGETKDLPIKVRLPKLNAMVLEQDAPVINVTLKYIDTINTKFVESTAQLCVFRDSHTSIANVEVDRQVKRLIVAEELEQARQEAEKGDFENARKRINLTKQRFQFAEQPDDEEEEMERCLNSDLTSAVEAMDTVKWHSYGNHQTKQSVQDHCKQRATKADSSYRNISSMKAVMMRKAKRNVQSSSYANVQSSNSSNSYGN